MKATAQVMKQKKSFPDKIIFSILVALTVVYGIACAWLYYHQLFFTEGGLFESDLPFHVSMAVEDHWFYSFTAVLYQLFYLTPMGNELTALFLAVVSVATVFATYQLLQQLTGGNYFPGMMLFFAVLGNFIMPFFLKWAHFQRYIGYQSASIWHNSTYACMKLLGILTFGYFLKLCGKYRDGLTAKEWISFAVLLILCNGVKPSFCMMFAPAMAVFLLAELFRKVPFRRVFLFGLAVVPSLLVIVWQNLVLFGEDTGNGILIKPGYALFMRGTHPKVTFLLSIAFPLLVLLFTLKDLGKDRLYRFVWLMWLFGFLEIFLFTEAGSRAKDSNFFWGYSMAIFFVNLIAMCKLLAKSQCREGIWKHRIIRYGFTVSGAVCLAYQVWCGVYFFTELLKGNSYWM